MDKEIASIINRAVTALERIADSLDITQEVRSGEGELDEQIRAGTGINRVFSAITPISAPTPPPPAASPSAEAAPGPVYTFEQVKSAIMAYQDREGWQAAQQLLKAYGATYIGQLKPEQFAAVMERLE